jgi:DtxR family Mn-dependent transcriptional regulator
MELAGLVSPMVAERLAATLPCDAETVASEGAVDTESTPSDSESA